MTERKNEITVLELKANGASATVKPIPNELKSFQAIVGGNIEVIDFAEVVNGKHVRVLCIINEEGKINDLQKNFAFPVFISATGNQTYYDTIAGDVFFAGDNGDDFRSLTQSELEYAAQIINNGRKSLYTHLLRSGESGEGDF